MNYFRSFVLASLFLTPTLLMAQSFDYVTGFGFNTFPKTLSPLTGDRWLAVCEGNPTPGGVYQDTVVAIVLTAEGDVLFERRLALPTSETYNVQSAVGTPDGGFAIAVALDLCDAGFNNIVLQVFDDTGALKWSKMDNGLPRIIRMSPAGELIGINDGVGKMSAYNLDTGAVTETFNLVSGGNSFYIRDFDIINGGATMLAIGGPVAQRWEKLDSSTYHLVDNLSYTQLGFTEKLVKEDASGSGFYTIDSYNGRIFLVNSVPLSFYLITDYPFMVLDIVVSNSKLIALAQDSSSTFLIKINPISGAFETIRTFAPSLQGKALSYRNNTLVVSGINESGPQTSNNPWLPYTAKQIWLHINHLNDDPPIEKANVALTQAIQNTSLTLDSSYFNWGGYYRYSLTGGQFQVEVKNLGETMLESVDVQTGFDWVNESICTYRPVHKRHYASLGLQPGESRWLDFGDIQAPFQLQIPQEICFWTSAPNHKPDAAPGDDVLCQAFSITIDTKELEIGLLTAAPNPANESILVSFPISSTKGFWKMCDETGRQVNAGDLEAGMSDLRINTEALVPGLYLLWINAQTLKIVIGH